MAHSALPPKIAAFFASAERPVVYFAHPMSTYGSQLEKKIIRRLRALGYDVFNPGAGWVQKEVRAYRKTNPDNYMQLFKLICDACQVCVVLPFPATIDMGEDAPAPINTANNNADVDPQADVSFDPPPLPTGPVPMLGAGVVYEMNTFFARPAPVFIIELTKKGRVVLVQVTSFEGYRKLDMAETRHALRYYRPD